MELNSHLRSEEIIPLFELLHKDVTDPKNSDVWKKYEAAKQKNGENINEEEQKLLEYFYNKHHQICGLPTFSTAVRYIILYKQYNNNAMKKFLAYYEKKGRYAGFGTKEWAEQQAKYVKYLHDSYQARYDRKESSRVYEESLKKFTDEAELYAELERKAKEKMEKEKIESRKSRFSEVLQMAESGVQLDQADTEFLINILSKKLPYIPE